MFVEHKEVGETKEAPAKTLKLSEAIRIGCALRPVQAFGDLTDGVGTCALGAALEGIYGYGSVASVYVYDSGKRNCRDLDSYLGGDKWRELPIAIHNDYDRWPREKIADWLESQGL